MNDKASVKKKNFERRRRFAGGNAWRLVRDWSTVNNLSFADKFLFIALKRKPSSGTAMKSQRYSKQPENTVHRALAKSINYLVSWCEMKKTFKFELFTPRWCEVEYIYDA